MLSRPKLVTPGSSLFPLSIAPSSRYLTTAGGVPFFMQGDGAAQTLVKMIPADQDTYIANRSIRGFNAMEIHVIVNAQDGGNADGSTNDGIQPFTGTLDGTTVDGGPNYDLTTPNSAYFARLDGLITKCARAGILVFLDNFENDSYLTVYQNNGDTRMKSFGTYLANRYAGFSNVVHMSGNDFQTWNTVPGDNTLAADVMSMIAAGDPAKLQTTELNYNISGSLDNALLTPFTGLASAYTYYPVYYKVLDQYNSSAKRCPVHLIESYYEGITYGLLTPTSANNLMLRKIPWWSALCGAYGYFYGSNFYDFHSGWQTGIDTTAVFQLAYWKGFFTSIPWWNLVPDQSNVVVTAGFGTATGNATGRIDTDNYVTTARVADGSLIVSYCPASTTITVDLTKLRGAWTARWYDPTTGVYSAASPGSGSNSGTQNWATPGNNNAGDPDWALRLDA